ncbi:SDR family oxidoreductase [Sphingomonas sp. 22176]|uniref:SDR family oxidoreductase n=1 Tax=Sphingomonas sp. 22176 TaxID=3453884 RepID=UPI003F84BFA8
MTQTTPVSNGTILLIGASRGLGLGMASEFAKRGWRVVATVRGSARTELHDLADAHPERIEIEAVDIALPEQIAAMRDRLAGRVFDMLFVNAGTANMKDEIAGEIASDEYARVLATNALGPLRVIEACRHLVRADGLIGVMSSGQGSITNNTNGLHEVYRSSKAALNQLVRSYSARHADDPRGVVLMAPGWIRTRLGGPNAPFGVEDSVPLIVDVLLGRLGKPGLAFLDRNGNTVPW